MTAAPLVQLGRYGAAVVHLARYGNGALAVILNDSVEGDRIAVLSVNLPEDDDGVATSDQLPPDHFYAKEWSENATIADECLASGWFEVTDLPPKTSGRIVADVWKLRAVRGEPFKAA
jgi:hypothetical protein